MSDTVRQRNGIMQVEYEEDVKEFTGLIFHCPYCDMVFHLHIARVTALNKAAAKEIRQWKGISKRK